VPASVPAYGANVEMLQRELMDALATQQESGGDRIALIDPKPSLRVPDAIVEARMLGLELDEVAALAATFYPWIRILDPSAPDRRSLLVPPSGHVAGILARTSRTGGPSARSGNERIEGAVGVERLLADVDRADLNAHQVCALRAMPPRGVLVFGARTLSLRDRPDAFLPASRTLAYLRRVLRVVGSTLVFEPNDELLRLRIRLALGSVLYALFRAGAFAGETAAESYAVRCDATTTPPDEAALGRVIALVDVALAEPLEFITIRIAFSRDGASVLDDILPQGGN
jgi:phage tail sheath protein FI